MLKLINLVLFTIAVIVGITFMTATPPMSQKMLNNSNIKLSTKYFPASIEVVGHDGYMKKEELFKKNSKTLLIVGNHDSLAVVKDLTKIFGIKMPYVMIANISNAPWFIKKWAIPGKLEELVKGIETQMIYDADGLMVKSLLLENLEPTKYFAYLVNKDGSIKNIYVGNVKEGALENGFTLEDARIALSPLMKLIK
jgi:hypothetical protein